MAVRKIDFTVPGSRKNITMRNDPRTLLLASYISAGLPTPPPSFDLSGKVKAWGAADDLVVLGSLLRGGLRRGERRLSDQEEDNAPRIQPRAVAG